MLIEEKLKKRYKKTVDLADDIVFIDKLIMEELNSDAEVEYVKVYASELLETIHNWKNVMLDYYDSLHHFKEELNEIRTRVQDGKDNS